MFRALIHFHKFEIIDINVRLNYFLYYSKNAIVFCDIICSKFFEQNNSSTINFSKSFEMNDFSQIVSNITDKFALISIMFEIEIDTKFDFNFVNNQSTFSIIKTNNKIFDLIIEKI